MRFLVDECTGPAVASWLRKQGHDVFSVYEQARGMGDDDIVTKAFSEQRILITNDKDFGERIFRRKQPHRGVVLLRLEDERRENKVPSLQRVLSDYANRLEDHFTVVTETKIRISGKP